MAIEILIVDDNADIRNILNELILDAGYKTRVAANYNQALSEIDKKMPDVAILDVKLDKGDNDGIELLSHIKSINKDIPVIVITGHANIEMAVNSLKKGAFEFVEKPFDQNRLLNFISRAVENLNLKNQNKEFENKLFSSYDLIGESKNIQTIRDQIDKISLTESRILLNGPSGSGKELVARKIHKNSKRNNKPFVILNGALLDSNKYELELFGEEKNNGAISYGALEKANKGTLLIDQVSEIPLDIQSKILRVLTDQKFKRLNGNNDVNVDVRLICSSSKDLKEEIKIGNFREDLYHRLNVFEINIKSLNERVSDIPLLIKYFSKKISQSYNIKELDIDENDSYILNHNWQGNVRELRNLIERIAILQPDTKDKISNIVKESLKNNNFDEKIAENSLSIPLKEARENFEKEYLTIQLKKFNGNISKTANFVGMERSALHRKLKGLGIKEFN
ncbi:sigma-54-dependent Fis family transcriptional regulator [Pelagibacterales bacterium SAG-MED11]|nr:sigma-54-dependent Fis family transcriptional regulator [Pelagibacterales bacterium SAG-MED11]